MTSPYPGEIARRRCAARTGAELLAYRPAKPFALRDELRLRGMAARCGACRACPAMIGQLAAMTRPTSAADAGRTEAPTPQVLRLAG